MPSDSTCTATPRDLNNAIVIIVSHSGGTFGPLATANLMQASTADIFLVASEWDTQAGLSLPGVRLNTWGGLPNINQLNVC
jgi:fructoselysine-6-P-deglycase FrlB-like protein